MFRVCAVHKFQSHPDPTATGILRLGTKSMQSQPVLIFIGSRRLLHEHTFVVLLPDC